MPLIVKDKPCFMALFWVLMLAGAIGVASPQQAFAGRAPDCGKVDRGLVKDIYAAARRVDYLVDVQGVMGTFCGSAENLYQWERELSRKQRSKDYKKARKAIIKNAENDLLSLKGRLIVLRGWASYDPHDKIDEARRRSKIKQARKKVLSSVMLMGYHAGQIQILRESIGE